MNGKTITRKGFSLFEMMIVVGILAMLAMASVPVAELSFNAAKEAELEESLDRMREAIELYKRDCRNSIVAQIGYDNLNKVPYWRLCPENLESLTNDNPVTFDVKISETEIKSITFKPIRYLENIPEDPFVGRACWLIHVASGAANVRAAFNFRDPETRGYLLEDFGVGITKSDPLPMPDWQGVFDVSCIASNAVDADDYYTRRGMNTSVDGTLYEDW